MKSPIILLLSFCFSALFLHAADKNIQLFSPDENIQVTLTLEESSGKLSYTVQHDGVEIIAPSALGITGATVNFTTGLTYLSDQTTLVDETYSLPSGKTKLYRNHYNELDLSLQKGEHELHVFFRAYDDGVAYRYLIPGNGTLAITGETSEIKIASFDKCWGQKYVSDYSTQYPARNWTETSNVENREFCAPILTQSAAGSDHYCLITEAANFGTYCVSKIKSGNASQTGLFYFSPTGNITAELPLETPWRTVIIGSLPTLVESVLIENLNPENPAQDFSWIEPGISAWDWGGQDGGQTNDINIVKGYIDLAWKMGWKYYILDEGWERSSYKLKDVVDYGDSRGVKIIIWSHQNRFQNDENQIRSILQEWKNLGFAGVKVDFWEDDRQPMMQKQDKLIAIAGELQLLVNLHGCTKPSGTRRYWQHLITSEAVYGGEQYYFNHQATPAFHNVTLALTRNVIGPMDYTPVEFARLDGVIRHTTTWSHQLALAILYESGVQCMSDSPDNYLYSTAKSFLKQFPTVWDETKCLEASIDQYVTIARRNGEDWYIASISQEPRTVNLPLDFLGDGVYQAQIYKDGASRSEIAYEQQEVTKTTSLSIPLLSQGGFTVRISQTPIEAPVTFSYEAESGVLSDGAVLDSDDKGLASGNSFVGYIGNPGKLTLDNITVETEGRYDLTVYFISRDDRNTYVKVNDGEKTSYLFRGNGFSWASDGLAFKTVSVYLNQGVNRIEFGNDTGFGVNIDRVQLRPSDSYRQVKISRVENMQDSDQFSEEESISVQVKNESALPLSGVKLAYTINDASPVVETLPELPAGNTLSFTFAQKADLSQEKAYYIQIEALTDRETNLAGDIASFCIVHYPGSDAENRIRVPHVKIHSFSARVNANEDAANLLNDNYSQKWCDNASAEPWVIFELDKEYTLNRFVFHDCRTKEDYRNIDEYTLSVTAGDPAGDNWIVVADTAGRQNENIKIDDIQPQAARYVKWITQRPAGDAIRVYSFELYGTAVSGIAETDKEEYFNCYVQENTLHLSVKEDGLPNSVSLYDVSGRKLAAKKNLSGDTALAFRLPNGAYVLQFEHNGKFFPKKIIVHEKQ
jgi:alpha-glucosidase